MADVETIDAIVRAAGFRMGPFELQDLVGIDVGYEVSLSFYELSFGEPRWRPSPLSARMVAAGRLGRKTGRGWYDYPRERAEDPRRPRPAAARAGSWSSPATSPSPTSCARWPRGPASTRATRTRPRARSRGCWSTRGADPEGPPLQGGPAALLCADGSLHALDAGGDAVGLPRAAAARRVAAGRAHPRAGHRARRRRARRGVLRARSACAPCGSATRPASCSGASSAQLVNEACFAVGEGVGSREDVDVGMVLGLNHPRGPFALVRAIGADHVLAVLDGAAHRARRGALPRRAAAAQAGHVSVGRRRPRLTNARG